MARSRKSQTQHDQEVRKIARKLEMQGYKVKADVKGYKKPDTIYGYRPDVIGKDGHNKKIYEVETKDSLKSTRDQKQQKAFRRAADKNKKTTFTRKITK